MQSGNLNAMHDLLSIMKAQNELWENANKKLSREISDFKMSCYKTDKMIKPGD